MEDFDFRIIFWIIIGLVYLFSRGRKKKAQPPPPRRQQAEQVETYETEEVPPPQKQLTFEELLREIEQMKQPSAPAPPPNPYRPPAKMEPEVVDYDDYAKEEVAEEVKPIEDAGYDYRKADKIYDVYEEAKKQAFERPSLEETVKLQDTIVRFSAFKGYEVAQKRNEADIIRREFMDRESFRKAFIMSEILKRRF